MTERSILEPDLQKPADLIGSPKLEFDDSGMCMLQRKAEQWRTGTKVAVALLSFVSAEQAAELPLLQEGLHENRDLEQFVSDEVILEGVALGGRPISDSMAWDDDNFNPLLLATQQNNQELISRVKIE